MVCLALPTVQCIAWWQPMTFVKLAGSWWLWYGCQIWLWQSQWCSRITAFDPDNVIVGNGTCRVIAPIIHQGHSSRNARYLGYASKIISGANAMMQPWLVVCCQKVRQEFAFDAWKRNLQYKAANGFAHDAGLFKQLGWRLFALWLFISNSALFFVARQEFKVALIITPMPVWRVENGAHGVCLPQDPRLRSKTGRREADKKEKESRNLHISLAVWIALLKLVRTYQLFCVPNEFLLDQW